MDKCISSTTSSSKHIIPLHGLSQKDFPTGCESVSTVCVLQYYGIDINVHQFIKDFLPCDTFYWKNGILYGPNPHEFFVGNPYKKASLGCYADVIMKALNKLKRKGISGIGKLSFQKISHATLEQLKQDYINKQIPVILWVTIQMKESFDGMQYHLEDGTLYTWKAQEHCIVLCGYDEENYYIMDPLADGKIVGYQKESVEKRYREMGMLGIVIYKR
ncbi:MAG: C39 family peptidase [Schaedlerella sp.]|nr:C39 family peptidase [Schaedlerella sp.]